MCFLSKYLDMSPNRAVDLCSLSPAGDSGSAVQVESVSDVRVRGYMSSPGSDGVTSLLMVLLDVFESNEDVRNLSLMYGEKHKQKSSD
jgi:hypothetical protein